MHGECFGDLVSYSASPDADDCLDMCKADLRCEYFTFYSDGIAGTCFLYSSCDVLDQACEECVSGERGCESSGGGEDEK